MILQANEGTIKIDKSEMHYVMFGKGHKSLVILPGLSDGLKNVKGAKAMHAMMYKRFAKEYRVYVFSRKNHMEEGYSTRDMARDQRIAMRSLGIENAHIMGFSQGGMIAQWLAIDYPQRVDKLVLAVSLARQNKTIQEVIGKWIGLAKINDYKNIIIDALEKTYSEDRLEHYRKSYPIISRYGKPNSFENFIVQAYACLNHDAYKELEKIKSPTLVIGGDSDKIAGKASSQELADKLKNSQLILYKGLGHGAFEEAKGFKEEVLEFLSED